MTSTAMKVARRVKRRKRRADGGAAFGTGSPAEEAEKPSGLANLFGGAYNVLGNLSKRAIENSQTSLDTGNYNPAPTMEAALLPMGTGAVAGVPMKAGEAVLGAGPIRAYHGSPHDFDRFDLSKIGTGEGAQAYGHGLYFAEKEGTARSYRDALAPQIAGETLGWRTHEFSPQARQAINASSGDIDAAIEAAQRGASRGERGAAFYGPVAQELEQIKAIGRQKPGGHMYEVNINADPAHFLDWDKVLSEQHPNVQAVATKLAGPRMNDLLEAQKSYGITKPHQTLTGQELVDGLAQLKGDTLGNLAMDHSLASNRLREAGIPGIKYLDQGSRAAGDGSRNFVVFNDKIIDILRKYGVGSVAALPPAVQAMIAEKSAITEPERNRGGSVGPAMQIARRIKRAKGGAVHVGPIIGHTGGRADKVPMHVPDGAYVFTADHVSGLGEGNTLAGQKKLDAMFPKSASAHKEKHSVIKRASGGKVPIYAADGEYVVHPQDIIDRYGDIDYGHKALDAWQTHERKQLIKTLGKLDPPAKD